VGSGGEAAVGEEEGEQEGEVDDGGEEEAAGPRLGAGVVELEGDDLEGEAQEDRAGGVPAGGEVGEAEGQAEGRRARLKSTIMSRVQPRSAQTRRRQPPRA
jgi:hypothetical protein